MDKDLEAILKEFEEEYGGGYVDQPSKLLQEFIIKSCKSYASQKIDEVIGEDESIYHISLPVELGISSGRNSLRAEQRQKKKDILE